MNPGCPDEICSNKTININLAYLNSTADDDDKIVHFIYSFGSDIGLPTFLIINTDRTEKIEINYTALISNDKNDAFKIIGEGGNVTFATGLVLTHLLEANDTNNDGYLPINNKTLRHSLANLHWTMKNKTDKENQIIIDFDGDYKTDHIPDANGTITIRLSVSDSLVRSSDLPRLQLNTRNVLISSILTNLTTNWDGSRFGFEMIVLSNLPGLNKTQPEPIHDKSIDDEYTPGIFKISTLPLQDNSETNANQSVYFQWKPVCYTTSDYLVRLSTLVNDSAIQWFDSKDQKSDEIDDLSNSAAFALWGLKLIDDVNGPSKASIHFAFGSPDDGFYRATNYSYWALSYGIGDYPIESVSVGVILAIACGLGLPLVLIVVGTLYVVIKRRMQSNVATYESINN